NWARRGLFNAGGVGWAARGVPLFPSPRGAGRPHPPPQRATAAARGHGTHRRGHAEPGVGGAGCGALVRAHTRTGIMYALVATSGAVVVASDPSRACAFRAIRPGVPQTV